MTNDELKAWDEERAKLQLAVDTAVSAEDKLAAEETLRAAEAAHQERFRAYTEKCQQEYMRKHIAGLR